MAKVGVAGKGMKKGQRERKEREERTEGGGRKGRSSSPVSLASLPTQQSLDRPRGCPETVAQRLTWRRRRINGTGVLSVWNIF